MMYQYLFFSMARYAHATTRTPWRSKSRFTRATVSTLGGFMPLSGYSSPISRHLYAPNVW